jgi:hypothetical protein
MVIGNRNFNYGVGFVIFHGSDIGICLVDVL